MRKNMILLLLAALAVVLTPAATATTSKTVAVSITRVAFVPKTVTINVNDVVKWTNRDTVNHQVACAKCPFTSPVLKPGDSFSHTFKKVGKFDIRDRLRKALKGTVTVKAPPKSVSLSAKPSVVTYRSTTKLSGAVSNQQAGEKVLILGKECGQPAFTQLLSVDTTTHGNYSTRVAPLRNTVYQAKWRASTSTAVSVRVRPKIGLRKVGAHKFRVRVRAAQSFAGKRVVFQRFRAATDTWVKVRRVKLKEIRTVGATVISGKTFKARVRHGRMVRIKMKSRTAAPCYLGAVSNTVTA